jgi:hypothetical protein
MTNEPLKPDEDALAQWQKLPQNRPSKGALPPMTGGAGWARGMLILLVILILVALLLQLRAG